MSRKQEKLWAQFERGKAFEPKISDVFAGVCIFVNGYTGESVCDDFCFDLMQIANSLGFRTSSGRT